MKLAISLPDALFREIDACARRDRVSRSRFVAMAARDFLARRRIPADPTEAWNRVIESVGQPGDDPAAVALRKRAKVVARGRRGRW